jgi:DHA1 family tetracycline resistance protein-like MFS transporter
MTAPRSNRGALVFVFITVLIDTIGFGIIFPVMPALIMDLTGETVSEAALEGGYLAFSFAVAQFIFGPVIGNLSDRFGRRPVLLFSLFAFGLDYLLMGVAPTLGWLFVGRTIAGIAGASFTTANACIADISLPENRAANFGLVGAAFGIGFIVGPAIGGLLGDFGPRAPFFAAAALALLNVLYGVFVLPETLPRESRRPFTWKRANTLGTILQIRRYPAVFAMFGVLFLWQLGHWSLPGTWSYYTKLRFGWSEGAIGLSLAYAGVFMALVQGGLARTAIPRLGEKRAAALGMLVGIVAFVGYAFTVRGWMMYIWMTVGALMGFTYPSINALMSRQIPATAQGELQGGVASIYSLTSILGPVIMTQLFGYFTSSSAPFYFPGAAFLCAALLTVFCLVVFARAARGAQEAPVEVGDVSEVAEVATE